MTTTSTCDTSSDVVLQLRAGDRTLRVAQITDKLLYLRDACTVEPCEAELLIGVNGNLQTARVILPDGIDERSDAVRFLNCSPSPRLWRMGNASAVAQQALEEQQTVCEANAEFVCLGWLSDSEQQASAEMDSLRTILERKRIDVVNHSSHANGRGVSSGITIRAGSAFRLPLKLWLNEARRQAQADGRIR